MIDRRSLLLLALAGCAAEPGAPPRPEPLLAPWRTIAGGFLGAPTAAVGMPARPSAIYVKFAAPSAVAIRGNDLLVADLASGRLWRVDTLAGTLSGVAGAPVVPGIALALGPDGSAWVLDAPARQVLRFGRDDRLLQTYRADTALPSPVALALADGGATLLLADGLGAQWSEQRGPGAFARLVRPAAVTGVNAIAAGRDAVFVLDRLAGVVHRVQRDGSVVDTLGRDELLQPLAIAVDRGDRVVVVDAGDRALKVLQRGRPTHRVAWDDVGLRQAASIAIDGALLAVADPLAGQVQLLRLGRGDAP